MANLHRCRQRFASAAKKKRKKTNRKTAKIKWKNVERQIICECNEWIGYMQQERYNGNPLDVLRVDVECLLRKLEYSLLQ